MKTDVADDGIPKVNGVIGFVSDMEDDGTLDVIGSIDSVCTTIADDGISNMIGSDISVPAYQGQNEDFGLKASIVSNEMFTGPKTIVIISLVLTVEEN